MAFANPAISDVVATTIQSRTGTVADNVTKNNAILVKMREQGNVKPFSGGNVIMQELSFQENGNVGWYSGYQALPIGAADVISSAQFDIKQAACPVTMSGLEMLQNSAKEQIIDLMESRIKVAEASMANLIAAGLYSDGTAAGGKQIEGLAKAIVAAPATAGVYGGIDRNTWAFWRNQTFAAVANGGAATTSANIQTYFNQLYAKTCRGNDHIDLIMVDNAYWALYMASLQNLQRFQESGMAKLGFPSVQYMQSDVVLDGGIGGFAPVKTAYFLNTKYLFLRPHRDRNFVPLDPSKRYSVNQDAVVQLLAWAGNLCASGLQFQGLLTE
jgi:hypothetical protein